MYPPGHIDDEIERSANMFRMNSVEEMKENVAQEKESNKPFLSSPDFNV